MTDRGDYLLIDSSQVIAELPAILKMIEEGRRRVRIVRDGRPIAEMSPVVDSRFVSSSDPDLKVTFAPDYDPTEGFSEDDWPEQSR